MCYYWNVLTRMDNPVQVNDPWWVGRRPYWLHPGLEIMIFLWLLYCKVFVLRYCVISLGIMSSEIGKLGRASYGYAVVQPPRSELGMFFPIFFGAGINEQPSELSWLLREWKTMFLATAPVLPSHKPPFGKHCITDLLEPVQLGLLWSYISSRIEFDVLWFELYSTNVHRNIADIVYIVLHSCCSGGHFVRTYQLALDSDLQQY